ncbi:hypothetical protein K8R04_04415 [Candidatus Uhrbacteria bacterium]|nr:hypothetical protein [Candidatus Uhrbacteria bacterium]
MFNPHARRPVDLTAYRNRRVVRSVPTPAPQKRNDKLVVLRARRLDAVIAYLLLAVVTASIGFGLCVNAIYVIAPRTPDLLPVSMVLILGAMFIAFGIRFLRKARAAWKECDAFDDKLERQRKSLANVIQPVERKLPLPFHDWMH